MKRTGPSNPELQQLIQLLRKESSIQKAPVWRVIADGLNMPTRKRTEVNLSSINRSTQPNEVIVVPGKVLGAGALDHGVKVAAFSFSNGARERIIAVKGTCLNIAELVKQNPKGTNVRIIA